MQFFNNFFSASIIGFLILSSQPKTIVSSGIIGLEQQVKLRDYFPFADRKYVLTVDQDKNLDFDESDKDGNNCVIYFQKLNGSKKAIIWKKRAFVRSLLDPRYEDFNEDGIKDLLLFSTTGARGGNEFNYLFLINKKEHTLTEVKDFNSVVNPSYNLKNHVILSLGLAGEIYYSLYRISKNKVYEVGNSFKENPQSSESFDRQIKKALKGH